MEVEEDVRQEVVKRLLRLGWHKEQLRYKPEWQVPATPHDISKREAGHKFNACGSADLAAFVDGQHIPSHLRVLFEFKEPDIDVGIGQLERYMSSEPSVKMGYWTNGTKSAAVYRTPDLEYVVVHDAPLPKPDDDFTKPPKDVLTFKKLREPEAGELTVKFKELLDTTVASDTRSTRREAQLDQLANVLLVKLDSDGKAAVDPDSPVSFRVIQNPSDSDKSATVKATADAVRSAFANLWSQRRTELFNNTDTSTLNLSDETIFAIVNALSGFRLLDLHNDTVATAFQVFRASSLKAKEGQYFTPHRLIRALVKVMDIEYGDKVIDPAAGTGGFVMEAARQIHERYVKTPADQHRFVKWANEKAFAVDIDPIGVKLTRAMMVAIGDGSTHTLLGDSLRSHKWMSDYPTLLGPLADGQYTVAITNPPFGKGLKLSETDARKMDFTITKAASSGGDHVALELGLVFLERCWRLVQVGGRVGIILPETYFFSHKYRWLPKWLEGRLALRGMFNIPMEAFQEFCRAKTNFYVFEKIGEGPEPEEEGPSREGRPEPRPDGPDAGKDEQTLRRSEGRVSIPRPSWFDENTVVVSTAATCGIDHDGRLLVKYDPLTGSPVEVDGVKVENNELLEDVEALLSGKDTKTLTRVPVDAVSLGTAVPAYYAEHYTQAIEDLLTEREDLEGFEVMSIADLIKKRYIEVFPGHGSPSKNIRKGEVPYIKVSDLRAGLVNINPTNRVPRALAERYWRGSTSHLQAFDLLTPARASKNIGDFCVLMPGQEEVLLTREILVFRAASEAPTGKKGSGRGQALFDQFYLLWALTLNEVRDQWHRVVFMQTNREDVGGRYTEILVPVPPSREAADRVSAPFREYCTKLAEARTRLARYLEDGQHHFFVGSATDPAEDEAVSDDAEEEAASDDAVGENDED